VVKRLANRTRRLAIRNAPAVLFSLAVAALVVVGGRSAGHNVLAALGSFVGLAALFIYYALRTLRVRRRAEEDVRHLHSELDHRVEERTAELEQVSARYVATLDRLLAGCQLIDFEWRYLYVNDAVTKHGRTTREQLLGHTMMECYPGIEHTPMFTVLERCMLSRTSGYIDTEFTFPDGTAGWFEISVHPAPEGIFVVSIEVTERKRAEVAVRQQLARMHSLRAIDVSILGNTDAAVSLQIVLEESRARLYADAGCIRLFDAASSTLEVAARFGNCARDTKPTVRVGETIVGRAALERRTVSDVEDGRPTFATALISKGVLVGALALSFREAFDPDREWIDFFETVAGQAAMAVDNGRVHEELQRSMRDLHLAYDTTIEGWSRALDLRDKETEGHTQRVTELTMKLARIAGISEAELVHVKRGALLHDIGKMGVPDHILLKPDKLTDEEWVHMRKHPTYAYELLKPIEYLRDALDIPYCHHEKWDGSGYPRGLKGEEIPLSARLFAVVDIWDAIRSDRPYRSGWNEQRSLDFIRSVSGTHLDPKVVELFLRVVAPAPQPDPVGVDR